MIKEFTEEDEYKIAKLTYASVATRLERVRCDLDKGISIDDAWEYEFGERLGD